MRSRNKLLCEPSRIPSGWMGSSSRWPARRRHGAGPHGNARPADGPDRRQPRRWRLPQSEPRADRFLDGETERFAFDLEEEYQARLRSGRWRDAAAGARSKALIAPIADPPPGEGYRAERCSTGEQKALLVGLVLAHARLVANMTGAAPILLLDEIAAHLDAGRRAALFDLVDDLGGQPFMTAPITDRAPCLPRLETAPAVSPLPTHHPRGRLSP